MAHIHKLTDKRRTLPWRAQVRRKGHKVVVKMFKTKDEAEYWASEQERTLRLTGLPLTNAELKKHYVRDIVVRYRDEKTPAKGCSISETTVFNKFLRHNICDKALAYVSRKDAYDYIKDRLSEVHKGKPIKPSTVRREINSIQHVFEVAREEWGFSNLPNPFRGIKIKGSMRRRKRRLEEGELEKLERACEDCRGLNQYYVPLAIYLAVETGMRLQEIFNLTWSDVEIQNRRIEIRRSKTDHLTPYEGRTIVLTIGAQSFLIKLRFSLQANGRFKPADKIFPMSKEAFKQSWTDVRRRADIPTLTFHDLRHEAASRFDEADLSNPQAAYMLGHAPRNMTASYQIPKLKPIQDKLDRYTLDGMTFDEAIEKVGAIVLNRRISGKPKAVPLEEAVGNRGFKFKSEEEMRNWIEKQKKKYSQPGSSIVAFPPQI